MNHEKTPVQILFTISLLGAWLIASTVTFGFQSAPLIYTNYICGVLLIVLGLISRKKRNPVQIWTLTLIGIWLQFSPLLFWAPLAASYVNDTFVGCWVIALAITLHPMPGHTLREQSTIPPGWSYNPSAWSQRFPIATLAFFCWMISRYLAAYQLGYLETVWDPFFDPGTKGVLESTVSKAFPVSDAGLGALAYTMEFFSTCQGGTNRWRTAPWLVLVFGILVIPVSIVSAILIILQPLVVGTWCTLCLITAVLMLIAIPFAIGEVAATIQFLRRFSKEKPFFTLLFRGGECPKERPDTLSPNMDQPISTIMKSALSGLTFPWGLIVASLTGIVILMTPSIGSLEGLFYNFDPIIGALITTISVIAFAEYARNWRWFNLLSAAALLAVTWLSKDQQTTWTLFLHICLALLVVVCTIPRGEIRERFSLDA